MSFCFNCQAEVTPEDRFCGNCGIAVKQPGAAAARRGDDAELLDVSPPQHQGGGIGTTGIAPAKESSPPESFDQPVSQPLMSSNSNSDEAEDKPEGVAEEASVSPEFQETIIETSARADRDDTAVAPESDEEVAGDSSAPSDVTPSDAAPLDAASSDVAGGASSHPATTGETPVKSRDTGGVEPPQSGTSAASAAAAGTRPAPRAGGTDGRPRSSATKQLEPGTLLYSRYEIVRRLGGGGMGAVYYAKDKNLGDAPRAVKEMVQANLDEGQHEKAIGDFKRESMLLASLEHASIPTIYDYFYDERAERFYLVMRYISGGDFLSRLRNAPGARIDELTIADWGMQVADVLHYLHSQRPPIIYRDLKPANLMIDGNSGRVMLIDFGIARWVQKEEKGVTAVGTMGYAPPELFSGKVEPRSDLYSLGATMFHLLTGADPQDNPLLIFDFTKNPRPRQINPAISNEIERILMRTVEYKPENRFRSAAEMRDTLAAHLERLRTGAVSFGGAHGDRPQEKTIAIELVYCGFCGGRIAADDVFCAHCGAKQPLAGANEALRAARATAKLVVAGTTELDASFNLQKDSQLVGRSDPHSNIFPEIDLSKFDPETKISRRHARIWREGETFLVEDLGSVNGTVVNDSIRLGARQPRVLENGDKLRLGETTLHFLMG